MMLGDFKKLLRNMKFIIKHFVILPLSYVRRRVSNELFIQGLPGSNNSNFFGKAGNNIKMISIDGE